MTLSLIIDCETTGLTLPSTSELEKQPRIIDFAVAIVENGHVQSEHEWLINPEEEISAEITKITGITNEMLVGQPFFRQVLGEIEEVFAGADQLFAHNAPFDCALLEYELRRCARTGFPWPKAIICTVQEYIFINGRRMKLTELYQHVLGRELKQEHRALSDVRALTEILIAERMV